MRPEEVPLEPELRSSPKRAAEGPEVERTLLPAEGSPPEREVPDPENVRPGELRRAEESDPAPLAGAGKPTRGGLV